MSCTKPRPSSTVPCAPAQALRAMQELYANVAAEHRAMHEFDEAWHATITPHQEVRAELAAWPHGVFPLRMMRSLGAGICSAMDEADVVCQMDALTSTSPHYS